MASVAETKKDKKNAKQKIYFASFLFIFLHKLLLNECTLYLNEV